MKKVISILLIFLILAEIPERCLAEEAPKESELYAKSAVLMDADSGRILYEKNGYEALANASTTKILTCIIALENCEVNKVVEASQRAASAPKVRLGMRQGQQFYLKDLLYGLMLESYNDCAVAIAEYIAGSTEEFAKLMNHKAEEIGCKDTYFITPNGLDAADKNGFHHTTAADLARIMRYCIMLSPKAEQFLEITGTSNYTFCEITGGTTYSCYNHNAFLQMMDGALSGKTGFTGNAGYCYVGALKQDGKTYIVALLACGWPNNKTYKWADTKKLMKYGLENYYKLDLSEVEIDESKLNPILVENGQTEEIGKTAYVGIEVKKKETGSVLLEKGETAEVEYRISKKLRAPVAAGTYVGKITIKADEEVLCEYQVLTEGKIAKIDYRWCLSKVWDIFLQE